MFYGNLINRLEEAQPSEPIAVGTDVTMYMWSDRKCYFVTEVIDDKHIKVKPWMVCADHSKEGGMGHQNWLYFKTNAERNEYLKGYFPDTERSDYEPPEEEWVYRYGKWMRMYIHTEMDYPECYNERERKHFAKHGWVATYSDLSGKVRFGTRDYYYDWEF